MSWPFLRLIHSLTRIAKMSMPTKLNEIFKIEFYFYKFPIFEEKKNFPRFCLRMHCISLYKTIVVILLIWLRGNKFKACHERTKDFHPEILTASHLKLHKVELQLHTLKCCDTDRL